MRRYEIDMILEVTEPGEELTTGDISKRLKDKFDVDMSNHKVGVGMSWDLTHHFDKKIYPGRSYTFTRLVGKGGNR